MGSAFASGKHAVGICDRCGFRYRLKELKRLIVKSRDTNLLVCDECWEPDHPQLRLGMVPIHDPQAIRNARPDASITVGRVDWTQLVIQAVSLSGIAGFVGFPPQSIVLDLPSVEGVGEVGIVGTETNIATPEGLEAIAEIGVVEVESNAVLADPEITDALLGEIGDVLIDIVETVFFPDPAIGEIGEVTVITNVATVASESLIAEVGLVEVDENEEP